MTGANPSASVRPADPLAKRTASANVHARPGGAREGPPSPRAGRETAFAKAAVGFEPTNNGFAIRPLGPLGYAADSPVALRRRRGPIIADYAPPFKSDRARGGGACRGGGFTTLTPKGGVPRVAAPARSAESRPVTQPIGQALFLPRRPRCSRVARALALAGAAWAASGGAIRAATSSEPAPEPAKIPANPAPTDPHGAPPPVPSANVPPAPKVARAASSRRVLREGSFLTNRRGRLTREGRDWLFEFDRDARGVAEPTMVMLPGQRLTEMERLIESRVESLTFVVSGEVFVYRGRNYLLPLFFSVARSADAQAPAPSPSQAPTSDSQPARASGNPSPEELLRGVERASAPERPAGARDRALDESSSSHRPAAPGLRREGEFLNLRKARVARTPGGVWRASLDNDPPEQPGGAPAAGDAPMTLLPCQTLTRIEAIAERAPSGLTISLSGHVFLYEGENYLLPTMFVVEYADVSDLRSGQ